MPRLSTQHRYGMKNRDSSKADYDYGGHMLPDEDFTPDETAEKYMCHYKRKSDLNQITFGSNDSTGNKEFWIKTDSDCKSTCINQPIIIIVA